MNDRKYVKLNTSIQTASNAGQILEDEEGNKEATLELRLPDNLFGTEQGPQKVDSVEMLTTKFRLSMENTPIAQIPLDMEKTTEDSIVSTCQLDVYPYCYLDDNRIAPDPGELGTTLSTPFYKGHYISFYPVKWDFSGEDPVSYIPA